MNVYMNNVIVVCWLLLFSWVWNLNWVDISKIVIGVIAVIYFGWRLREFVNRWLGKIEKTLDRVDPYLELIKKSIELREKQNELLSNFVFPVKKSDESDV